MADDINVGGSLNVDLTLQVSEKSKKSVEASIKELEGKLNGDLGLNINKESINHVINTINSTLVPALRESISDGFKKGLEDGLKSLKDVPKKIDANGITSGSSSSRSSSGTNKVAKDTSTINKNYGEIIQKINQSANALSKLTGKSKDYSAQIDKIVNKHSSVASRQEELKGMNAGIEQQIDLYKEANKAFKDLVNPNTSIGKESIITKLWNKSDQNSLRTTAEELKTITESISKNGIENTDIEKLKEYVRLYNQYKQDYVTFDEITKKQKNATGYDWASLTKQLQKYRETLSKIDADGVDDLNKNVQDILTGITGGAYATPEEAAEKVRELKADIDKLNKSREEETKKAEEAAEAEKKYRKELSDAGGALVNKLSDGLFFGIGNAFIRYFTQSFHQIINYVVQIDDALTQVAIVTNNSVDGLSKFADEAVDAAQKVGASVTDIMKSVETWARLGYDLSDSTNLAAVTAMYSNVAATSVDDATTSLTSILKGFNLTADEAENVIDKLTLVGQNYAISAAELGTALQKGGAALYAGGNSLDEAIALITAANSAIQNASTVGTMMKTMSARLRASKTELEEMGEDLDGVASSASKMRAEILALSGVDIMLDDSTYKSTYQIMLEISKVWDNLTDVSKANLLEKIAGKRGASVVQSLITNIKDMEGAYNDSMNAMGTASKANEVYLDSISGKMALLTTNVQQLSQTLFNSNLFKDGITVLSFITEKLTYITGGFNNLIPKVLLFSGLLSKSKDGLKKLHEFFTDIEKAGQRKDLLGMGKIALAVTTITLAIEALKYYGSVYQNAAKNAELLNQEYQTTQSELDSLNNKLSDNKARIEEIQSLGNITIMDQKELEVLSSANRLLEQQIADKEVLAAQQKQSAQQAAIDAANIWGSGYQKWWYRWLLDFDEEGNPVGSAANDYTNQTLLNTYLDDPNKYRKELLDFWEQVQEVLSSVTDEEGNVISGAGEVYAEFKKYSDEIYKALDPTSFYKTKLTDVLKQQSLQDLIDELYEMDEITEETLSDGKFKPFLVALEDAGLIIRNEDTKALQDLDKVANIFKSTVESIRLTDAFYDLDAGIASALSSLEAFDNAINTQKDDAFKGYVDAYQKVADEIAAGRINSNTFWKGMELFLGKDALKEAGYDAAVLVQQFEKIGWLYESNEDSGATFVNYLVDHATELAGLLNTVDKEVIKLNDDGSINFDWDEESIQKLCEYLGVTRDQFDSLMYAANNYGDFFKMYDINEVVEALRGIGSITDDSVIAIDAVEASLLAAGRDSREVQLIMQELREMEGFTIFDISDDETINDMIDTINYLNSSIMSVSGEELYVDATALTQSLQDLGYSQEAIDKYIQSIDKLDGVTISNPVEPDNGEESITSSIDGAVVGLQSVYDITTDINSLSLDAIQNEFSDLNGRIKDVKNNAYLAQTAIGLINAPMGFASGTEYAKSGLALTGEIGPEIIWDSRTGRSMIVGLNGPEMHRFAGGETVFNSAETAQIFSNSASNKTIFGSYASGTSSIKASVTGTLRRITAGSSGVGSSSSGGSSSSASSSSSSTSSSVSNSAKSLADLLKLEADKAKDEIEARVDAIKDEEDALKDAADAAKDLAEAQQDVLKNEADIAKEALQNRIDVIEKEADDATDALDKEIDRLKEQLVLLKETNEQEDKALKLQQAIDAYEAAKKAKTARVYTADKGWIWVADPDAVKSAKDTLDELYKEYARDDAEKAINDQIDAIEKEKDAIKEQAEEQKKILKELSDAWDEQLDKVDYTVEEYQKYMNILNKYTEMGIADMSETITDFGNQIADVMQLNSEAEAAKTAYETFSKAADAEIEKLNDLKQKWSEYASNVSKTLEEYNKELEYAAQFSTMSFDQMTASVENYMTRVKEAMRLNSQANGSKGYASGSTSIPSTGAKIVDEYGQELIVHKPDLGHYAWLEKGDGVVPADITRRLMALGTNPAAYLSAYAKSAYKGLSGVNTSTTNYNFGGDIVLNNVKDAKSFFTEFEQEINLRQTR